MLTNTYRCPRLTCEYADCALPMTFDQYKKCGFDCLYCFARYQRENNPNSKDYMTGEIKSIDIEKVKKIFLGKNPKNPLYKNFIAKKKVLQWGSMADPFDPIEATYGLGYELMEFFAELEYPIRFSTKATLPVEGKYYEFLKKNAPKLKDKWAFTYSIITLDEEASKQIEIATPSPLKRYDALKKLKDLGYYTIHRLRPFMLGISDKTLNEMLLMDKKVGVDAISTEFFCLDTRVSKNQKLMYDKISKIAGFDYIQFYKKNSVVKGYERLNPKIKEPHVKTMKDFCKANGILFSISDAHFKELNDTDCCCGLPASDGPTPLSNYQGIQLTAVISRARKKYIETGKLDKIHLKDIDIIWMKDFMYREMSSVFDKYKSAKRRTQTVYDDFVNKWNDPSRGSSPYKYFFGRLTPVGTDKDNNVIYTYNPSDLDIDERITSMK